MDTLLKASVAISAVGIAVLAVTLLLGFETPDGGLVWLSALSLLATPLLALLHLAVTNSLTDAQKRIWFGALTGKQAAWALAEYLCTSDRRSIPASLGDKRESATSRN